MRPVPTVRLAAALLLPAAAALAVQPNFRIYDDQFVLDPLKTLSMSIKQEGTPLSQITTSGAATGLALEQQSSWDFSPMRNLVSTDSFGQAVPATQLWTCYLPDTLNCGFGAADIDALLVGDGVTAGNVTRDVSAVRYDEATGILSGRALVQNEGSALSGTDGEVRLCLGTGAGAPVVAAAVFPHVEAGSGRRYFQFGDADWGSPVFDCFAGATLGAPCRATGGQSAALDADPPTTEGRIRNRFVRTGTVTLPTGHVLDAFMVESLTSYTAKSPGNCLLNLLTYKQWRLAWLVPYYGSVASVTSDQNVASLTAFTTAKSSGATYGLLPPLSIQATQVGSDSVTVTWDPGLLGERGIDGYEVHWGAVSGRTTAPTGHSGPIPAGTRSYTITGLSPSTAVHVSVTTRRSYRDPKSRETTAYESIKLPQVIGADTNGDGTLDTSYPPEVKVTTTGVPGPCVAGDIFPDGVGSQSVTLADYAIGRRKLLGTVAVNARDTTCGDVHPGSTACAPAGQPSRWCIAGNATFQTGDVVSIRRRVAGSLVFDCNGCPQVARLTGDEMRLPGDVAPSGATDGVVDVSDAVTALRVSVGLVTPTAEQALRGDVSPVDRTSGFAEPVGDGRVDVSDVVLVLRTSVGLEQMRWPVRKVRARVTDRVDFIGFRAEVRGWPTWAVAEASFTPLVNGCDDTSLGAFGDDWIALCVTDPVVQSAPLDLFEFAYRAVEDVATGSLTVVTGPGATYVTRSDLSEPEVALQLSTP